MIGQIAMDMFMQFPNETLMYDESELDTLNQKDKELNELCEVDFDEYFQRVSKNQ